MNEPESEMALHIPLRQLIERCASGEDDAIAELVRRFQPWALDLASALAGDRDLAEDAVQESFLAALEHLADLRDPDAFPGWFRQLVRTQACRIARRRRDTTLDSVPEASDDASPESEAHRQELRTKVREALAALPPAGRETAELFYLDDRSCAEIAGMLQVPEGTVKRRLHDARGRLRAMLLGYIVPESDG